MSLNEARENFKRIGAKSSKALNLVRPPTEEEKTGKFGNEEIS